MKCPISRITNAPGRRSGGAYSLVGFSSFRCVIAQADGHGKRPGHLYAYELPGSGNKQSAELIAKPDLSGHVWDPRLNNNFPAFHVIQHEH
jgi:hypothetical protein